MDARSNSIWFTDDAIKVWRPEKTGGRGRPKDHSGLVIEPCLFLRLVFSLPLRQAEGFTNSLVQLMHL
ncbi:transposase [Legionella massiliensis]|uniref:transposase n=1 Tax=Legionella massiliensis TaxID=1034943 RepID=UPI00159EEE32